MLAVCGRLWCGCQNNIVVLHPDSLLVEASFVVDGEGGRGVACMASEGSGVWVALTASTQVRLYHPATYECLAEVDVTAAVSRMLAGCDAIIRQHKSACLRVTSLTLGAELLWVGTSAGVLVTLPHHHLTHPGPRRHDRSPPPHHRHPGGAAAGGPPQSAEWGADAQQPDPEWGQHDSAGSPGLGAGAPSPTQRWPAVAPVGCLHGHTGHVRFITSVRLPEGCVWAEQGGPVGAPDQTPKAPRRDSGKRLRASGLPGVLGGAGPVGGHAGGPGALLVISGGDGYEEFTGSPSPGGDDAAGRDDSTNHLLLWRV
uniref:Rho guanine nucleotide exchange factor 17-like n=1 Tax=Petromyzon marinus TaxID=7757 RepID=A0AAJ7WVP0_PETMA|nr:rho guanine nucleotide exchange factor 17-like [Petromyzon marinus]